MKNDDVIRAWKGGKNLIQYRIISGNSPTEWIDLPCNAPVMPNFQLDWTEWRIKPLEYRIALFYDRYCKSFNTYLFSEPEITDRIEKRAGFERWLTDWIKVEI